MPTKFLAACEKPVFLHLYFFSHSVIALANMRTAILVVVGYLIGACMSVTVSSYLSGADQDRLKAVFSSASPYKDLANAYWSLKGLDLLKALPKDLKAECQALKTLPTAESAEAIFYLTEAAKLTKCAVTTSPSQQKQLQDALAEKKVSSIYYAYNAMKNSKMTVNEKDVNAALETALKTDEVPTSMAYAFLLTSALKQDVEKRYQLIEDVFAQADVVDNNYMQFEGGVFTTAIVVEASYQLATQAKKAPTLKPDQVLQLSNYLLSRRHTGKLKSAVQLLSAVKTLSDNQFHIPLAISVEGSNAVSSASTKVSLRVSNLIGGSVGKLSLTADSARHIADDAVVLSKKQLAPSAADSSVFELDFANVKAPFGFYRVQLTASPAKADAKLLGLKGSVELKVVTAIKLDSVELGVGDLDQSAPKTNKITYPGKAASKLSADTHQRVVMTFFVKSKSTNEALTPHQVFVRLTHQTSGQEIVFIPTYTEGTSQYKFELDVGAREKDFGSLSGGYTMGLLVGDAIIENPLQWELADMELSFSRDPSADDSGSQYKAKPVINHMFREPEKRPAAVVSNVFTVLCLMPFLIMLALWLKIGANVSDFPMSLSAIGFHIGVAAIFGLYFLYWTQLNMFETIKYLTILAIPTFLCGNQLLSSIASKRKAK